MCDQSTEMRGGESGPDGEETLAACEGGREDRLICGKQHGRVHPEGIRGDESGAGGDVGQEDEEMTSGSHDLSSSANHSPRSATGSTSASTKRFFTASFT